MKIAFITSTPHNYIGGVESYTKILIEELIKTNEVSEFSLFKTSEKPLGKPIDGVHTEYIGGNGGPYLFGTTKKVNSIIDEYDVVISNVFTTKKSFYAENVIRVQHGNWKYFTPKSTDSIFNILNYWFLGIGYWRNPMKANHVVFFNESSNKFNSKDATYIPTIADEQFFNFAENNSRQKIMWVGRTEKSKGIKYLNNIYDISKYKENFITIGSGPMDGKIKSNPVGAKTKGEIAHMYDNCRVSIMTSQIEGMPIVIAESLAKGVPVILFDTFETVNVYRNCPGVFIIENKDVQFFSKSIDHIMNMNYKEWKLLSKSCIDFANENLSKDIFLKKWKKHIDKIYALSK